MEKDNNKRMDLLEVFALLGSMHNHLTDERKEEAFLVGEINSVHDLLLPLFKNPPHPELAKEKLDFIQDKVDAIIRMLDAKKYDYGHRYWQAMVISQKKLDELMKAYGFEIFELEGEEKDEQVQDQQNVSECTTDQKDSSG